MIKLTIDNKTVEVAAGTTILDAAATVGITIPTLCYLKSCSATGSCMVCAVQDLTTGKLVPACAARCENGMQIASSSDTIITFRRSVIELLLNEHRGDCQAPCQLACPHKLDISTMLHLVVQGKKAAAAELLFRTIPDPQQTCSTCRGNCELACRRGRYDSPIKIRPLIAELSRKNSAAIQPVGAEQSVPAYSHRFGAVTETDMKIFLADTDENNSADAARCLRCDCRAVNNCQLRQLATKYAAKQQRFGSSSVTFKRIYYGEIGYELGKCTKCGNCIAVGERLKPGTGPVFSDRGATLTVAAPFGVKPDRLFEGIADECLQVCPTGALFKR